MAGERKSLKGKMRPCALIERIDVTGPEVAIFKFQPREGQVFDFRPGQYATLGLDVGEKFVARAYSIASSPYTKEYLEFYINVIKEGELTPSLFALRPGDEAYYMGPKGLFTLAKTTSRNLLFIATGTGLAPYMSMLRTLYHDQCAGRPHGRTITLVHGVRFSADLGYREELTALARDPAFGLLYLPMVSRVAQDEAWTPELGRGRITELLEEERERVAEALPRGAGPDDLVERCPHDRTAVFLCGNPDMITDATARLRGRGCHIYTEEYW